MPIDSSVYKLLKGADFVDSYNEGKRQAQQEQLTGNQLQMQNEAMRKQKGIDDAYSAGVVKNPDGTVTFDRNKTAAALAGVGGKEYLEGQAKFAEQDKAQLELQKQQRLEKVDNIARLTGSVTDQASYDQALQMAPSMGLDVSKFPKVYDPRLISQYRMQALSAKEQLEQQNKVRELDLKAEENRNKRVENANKSKELGIDRANKYLTTLKDDLDPNKARGGNLAKSQAMLNSAERVNGLFDQFPDGNIPANQSNELASAVAGLINGGSAQSQHQIDSLTPQSMRGDAQKIAAWVTNEPLGLEQQAFMKMMKETVDREAEIATDQVRRAQIQRLAAHKHLRRLDPEGYNAVLQSYGITPDMIDEKGQYKKAPSSGHGAQAPQPVTAQSHPEANAAMSWAKQNPNDPRAQAIMKRLGQ